MLDFVLGMSNDRTGSVDEQRAQIAVTSFANAQQDRLAAAGMLPGNQAHPGSELPGILEAVGISDRRHQRACCNGPDPGNLRSPLTSLALLMPEPNLLFQLFYLPIQFLQIVGKSLQQIAEAAGQLSARGIG